jgi:hypothetical protein
MIIRKNNRPSSFTFKKVFCPMALPQTLPLLTTSLATALPLHHFDALVPLLQASLSPVTVISGVGLLLMSMSNRYGRIIDQVRHMLASKDNYRGVIPLPLHDNPVTTALETELALELRQAEERGQHFFLTQLQLLYRRARIVRWSIVSALMALFLISLTIVLLFSGMLFKFNLSSLTGECFLLALIMLLLSMSLFILDVSISLNALKLELTYHCPNTKF